MDTLTLPCPLTEAELLERGQRISELVREHGAVEEEKRSAASEYKTRLDDLDKQIRDLAVEVRSKSALRPVEVRREKDYERDVEETIRCDTGEVIETRALAPGERQAQLFDISAARGN